MIYFDNAATTMQKPGTVVNAIRECASNYGANPGRSGHRLSMLAAQKVYECRELAAKMFEAEPENVVFTQNCTHALNLAIKGVMERGGHIVISDLEHNSVFRPVYRLAKAGKITFTIARVYEGDFAATVRSFESCITPQTRMIACTAGSNLCGVMLPCDGLADLCRRYNLLLLLDCAQTAGVVKSSLKRADFLCMPGHKGLYGPTGTGMLVTDKGEMLETVIEGGTGSQSYLADQPSIMPDKLESGTLNTYGIAGLNAGMHFVDKFGAEKIYKHELALTQALYDGLTKIQGIRLYTERPQAGTHLPVLCFNLKDSKSEAVVEELSKRGFALRGGYHCAPLAHEKLKTSESGAVRASFSLFNTHEQVERFLFALKKI